MKLLELLSEIQVIGHKQTQDGYDILKQEIYPLGTRRFRIQVVGTKKGPKGDYDYYYFVKGNIYDENQNLINKGEQFTQRDGFNLTSFISRIKKWINKTQDPRLDYDNIIGLAENNILLREYSQKVVDQLLAIYKSQTDLDEIQIKNYIKRFDELKSALKQKFENPNTKPTVTPLIPQDLQDKNRYLDITLWRDFPTLKRMIDGISKKAEDIYSQAIKYYKKKNPDVSETAVKNYVARFKQNVKNLETKVKEQDETALGSIPKDLLDGNKYLLISNWKNFIDLEHMLDAVFPLNTGGGKGNTKVDMNSAETDADKIYNEGGIEIYKGDSEHKCIRYGKNAYYSWCISRPNDSNLYANYRFGGGRGQNLMFYFIFDRNKTDEKDGGRFKDPYHAVVIHALEDGKYTRTTANNDGDSNKTSWEDLGQYFPGKQGQDLWNKIKGLKDLFKYIPPSNEELKQKEYRGKKFTIEQFVALPHEDKVFWLRANATNNKIITPEITKTLPAELKNDLINHGKQFSYDELKSNQGLLKRYPDYRFTRFPDEPIPYIFIPYLKEELQREYYEKFEEKYLTFDEIDKYFSKNIVKEYVDKEIKDMDFLPPEATKYMNDSQKKLYDIYSISFKNIKYYGDSDVDNDTVAPTRQVQIDLMNYQTYSSLSEEERKSWLALIKKVGNNVSNIEKYNTFFFGIPTTFLMDKFYFFMPKDRTESDVQEYYFIDEDGKILSKENSNIMVYKDKKELDTSFTGVCIGSNSFYITDKDFDIIKFEKLNGKTVDVSKQNFQSIQEVFDQHDWFSKSLLIKAGIIK